MKCESVRELLAEYRTGILNERTLHEVEEHLAQCEDCARELDVLDCVLAEVESDLREEYEPPVGLWNGVYNKITMPGGERGRAARIGRWLRAPVHAAGTGLVLAAAVAALVITTSGPMREPELGIAAVENRYVQAHAYSASHAPLADRVGFVSLMAISQESEPETRQ